MSSASEDKNKIIKDVVKDITVDKLVFYASNIETGQWSEPKTAEWISAFRIFFINSCATKK